MPRNKRKSKATERKARQAYRKQPTTLHYGFVRGHRQPPPERMARDTGQLPRSSTIHVSIALTQAYTQLPQGPSHKGRPSDAVGSARRNGAELVEELHRRGTQSAVGLHRERHERVPVGIEGTVCGHTFYYQGATTQRHACAGTTANPPCLCSDHASNAMHKRAQSHNSNCSTCRLRALGRIIWCMSRYLMNLFTSKTWPRRLNIYRGYGMLPQYIMFC
jgi:hypothetical protein